MSASLVDQQTGEVVQQCDQERARDLTEKIRTSLGVAWELVKDAYRERAWAALGYSSWDAYVSEEFGAHQVRLPREERREVVGSLREAGLSIRAIASATGVNRETVRQEVAAGDKKLPPAPEHRVDPADYSMDEGSIAARQAYMAAEHEKVTGTDGKQYPAARPVPPKPSSPPKPQRRPLPDSFFDAAFDLTKKVESVHRLTEDDRFSANREKVAAKHRNDLLEASDLLQQVINRLDEG